MYLVGTTVRVSCAFRVDGTLTDPTTVTLKVSDPSGNLDTYTYSGGGVTKAGTGDYYRNIAADEAGRWVVQWIGTGAAAGLEESFFKVDRATL